MVDGAHRLCALKAEARRKREHGHERTHRHLVQKHGTLQG